MISFRNTAFFDHVTFERAVMPGVCFVQCEMADADFTGTNLRGADFRGAIIRKSVFVGADLEGAIGLVPLPVADPRPVRWVAVAHPDVWWVAAGAIWLPRYAFDDRRAESGDDGLPRITVDTLPFALRWLSQVPLPSFEEIAT